MAGPIVETASGKLRGRQGNGVAVFKGIPYAAPPVGPLRFRAPQPHAGWSGVRDALTFGASAMQDESAFPLSADVYPLVRLSGAEAASEDCLVLNVWTPAVNDGCRRPVMVWLHGGAFVVGSGSVPWNDGSSLARNGDVVVVSLNHRLGVFGYLHVRELGGDASFADAGDAGVLDLVAALTWVRDNIAGFGGDPGNVTIFGESGGGAKVSVLMAMPAARGLLHKAVIQSGPAVEMASRQDGDETARLLLDVLGLDSKQLQVLRELPAERLLQAQVKVLDRVRQTSTFTERRRKGFNPVVDGQHLPGGPFAPTAPAIAAQVPLMIGTNKDEMSLMLDGAAWLDGGTDESMVTPLRVYCGDRARGILAAYRRARPTATPRQLAVAITSDLGIRMPSLLMADRKVAQGAAAVFVYTLTWETPVLNGRLGAPHTLEIPFVFDTVDSSPLTGSGEDRYPLAARMRDAWVAFARSGDPNHAGLPPWPRYDAARPTMVFDRTCRVDADPFGEERRAWSEFAIGAAS
jgi:para-nitrobenzyl esterase